MKDELKEKIDIYLLSSKSILDTKIYFTKSKQNKFLEGLLVSMQTFNMKKN